MFLGDVSGERIVARVYDVPLDVALYFLRYAIHVTYGKNNRCNV